MRGWAARELRRNECTVLCWPRSLRALQPATAKVTYATASDEALRYAKTYHQAETALIRAELYRRSLAASEKTEDPCF